MSHTISTIRTLFGRKAVVTAAIAAGAIGGSVAMTGPASAATPNWDAIAQKESTGNWHINTGNGYGGGLQISPTTSAAMGGPSTAAGIAALSKGQQIALAEKILAAQGPHAWPNTYTSGGTTSASTTPASHSPAATAAGRNTAGHATHSVTRVPSAPVTPTHKVTSPVTHTGPAATHTTAGPGAKHTVTPSTGQRPLFTTALAGTYRADVAAWQAKMAHLGYTISVDGHYGKQSATVALAFQKAHNLLVDGIVGPQTWGATFR